METRTKKELVEEMNSVISDLADLTNLLRTIGYSDLNNEQILEGEIEAGYRSIYESIINIYRRLSETQEFIEQIDEEREEIYSKCKGYVPPEDDHWAVPSRNKEIRDERTKRK